MKNDHCKWYCTNLYDTNMMDLFLRLTGHWFLVDAQVHHRWALSQQSLSRGPREKWMKHEDILCRITKGCMKGHRVTLTSKPLGGASSTFSFV